MKQLACLLALVSIFCLCVDAYPAENKASGKTASRTRDLKRAIRHFGLDLSYYGDADKPYYHLIISVQGGWEPKGHPFYRQARITTKQAEEIVDHLAADGFFEWAVDAEEGRIVRPCYEMSVAVDDNGLSEDLGWGLPMLKRLEGLRKVLHGGAAKEMDLLLGRLEGHRKEWEKEAKDAKAK